MAHSSEKTVLGYINSLPKEKTEVISYIRDLMLESIPDGIVETMNWGMISYEIPLKTYPNTYNKQPLMYAALAAQKNHFSIYLTNLYMNDEYMPMLIKAYEDMGLKPNIGKSCIRFRRIENIPINTIIEIVKSTRMEEFISKYESSRG